MEQPFVPPRPLYWPDLVNSVARLLSDGPPVYVIGGPVRDAVRGAPLHDLDLATPGDGLAVARYIADALGGAYYPVDPTRRTGRVILAAPGERSSIDVASFRGPDLLSDLKGRDFTINAMAVSLAEPDRLIDPLGGYADLFEHKTLRQCSPSSLHDDPVRAVRAIRHALELGLRIESLTRSAMRQVVPMLTDGQGRLVQPERFRDEIFKLLAQTPRQATALRLLNQMGILQALYPYPQISSWEKRIEVVERLSQLMRIISSQRDDNTAANLILGVAVMVLDRYRAQLQEHLSRTYADERPHSVLLVLAALTPSQNTDIGYRWAEHLRLSRAESTVLEQICSTRRFDLIGAGSPDVRFMHRYYRATGESGIDGILLSLSEFLVDQGTSVTAERWGRLLEDTAAPLLEAFFRKHQQVVAPPPLVNGGELMEALKLPPSPHIGFLLTDLLEAQAAGEIRTKKEALDLARSLLSNLDS